MAICKLLLLTSLRLKRGLRRSLGKEVNILRSHTKATIISFPYFLIFKIKTNNPYDLLFGKGREKEKEENWNLAGL